MIRSGAHRTALVQPPQASAPVCPHAFMGWCRVGRADVTDQVHTVVKQPQHLDESRHPFRANPEDQEMPARRPASPDMERIQTPGDFVPSPYAAYSRAGDKRLQRCRKPPRINRSLGLAELIDRIRKDFFEIPVGSGCQPDDPGTCGGSHRLPVRAPSTALAAVRISNTRRSRWRPIGTPHSVQPRRRLPRSD